MQITAKHLSHTFDRKTSSEFKALDDVSATIAQGEFVAIIGHTGSGKTTFIEHLNALSVPTSGSLILEGITNVKQEAKFKKRLAKAKSSEIANEIKEQIRLSHIREIKPGRGKIKNVKDIRKRVGIVFQFAEYQLFEETILKDIIFGPVSMGMDKEKAQELAKKYIKLVGMNEDFLERSPFALSGGQKRRVALAGILAMEPDFLVLDEPTAGLDPQGEKDMYEIFKKLNKDGKTLIVVTHNLDHVLEHTERTLMFKHGKLIRDEKSLDLMFDIDFLKNNELEPPKLSAFVHTLETENKKIKIGKVRSIQELAKKLKKK